MTDIIESPDLQQLGKQALQDLLNNLTQAKAFAVDQAPEFCQQIIARGMWMPLAVSVVALVVALVAMLVCFVLVRRAIKNDDMDEALFTSMFPAVTALIAFSIAIDKGHMALAVYVAPKVFLVEELMRMVK